MSNSTNFKKDQDFKKWLKKNDKFYKDSFITNLINFDYREKKFNKYFFEYYIFKIETKKSTKENFYDLIDKEVLNLKIEDRFDFIIKLFNFYHRDCSYMSELKIFLNFYFNNQNQEEFDAIKGHQLLKIYLNLKDSLLKARVRNFNYLLILINNSFYNIK
ncbi:/ / hypothetical protein / 480768:481262 Reverse [Candidatus Hepatoplasma crinochetorum]|uniref:Uncharacterized protein n=1 Tax=Candidatus Hepatoplasma crinochetorum TaxID=295596 RepID=A0A0G7ZN87_9MOLU|nr:/ / hypothetical protein / 480768:481262 Reverse [Candidatus Hepatoplasma crinochetorum]